MNSMKKAITTVLMAIIMILASSSMVEAASLENGKIVVEKGDTLYKISKTYKVTVKELKEVNKLTSDAVKIGQELALPTKEVTVKGKISFVGLADSHTAEMYNKDKKEYFAVQITKEQAKILKNKKNFKVVVYEKGTTKLVSVK